MDDKLKLKEKDLVEIYNIAVNKMIGLSTRSRYQQDSKMSQTYAFTCAIIMYFNSKSLLKEEIEVDEAINPKYIKD